MSTRRVQSSAIKPRTLGAATAVTPWVRNPSWLALTAVGDSEQRFRGLVAVFPQGSYLALSAAGAYTVDWGDGTTANVNTGVTANHLYDFSDADLANTNAPVTLTDAGDLVERTAHGYVNGMEVRFYNIVSTTGLTTAQTYYVISATANNFQVAATVGGSAIALTTNGSATLLPYKQAIVVVTPQAGASLTSIDINKKHNATGLQAYETGWLDIEASSPNFTSLTIGGTNVRFAMCERAAVRSIGSVTNLSSLFSNYRELQSIILPSTAAVTNMSSMFIGCFSLATLPLLNTAAATDMNSMFQNCVSLTIAPFLNTALVTNMSNMFNNCASLSSVPLYNTAAATSMASMFRGCSSLTTVPLFNTALVTAYDDMFNGCSSLVSVPLFVFKATGTVTAPRMFRVCTSLASVPLFDTTAVTNMEEMFNSCSTLASVPLFNTAAVTTMSSMFANCPNLTTIPLLNTAAVTNASLMFNGCNSLSSVPALNVSAVSSSGNFANMFLTCNSLSRIQAEDFRFTFSVANCKLGAAQLDEIYTNLPVAVGQTITVSNNVGTTGDDPTIATNKGWTVTG